MATYNHLPVYKASYDLLVELFRFTKDFTREYKYTIKSIGSSFSLTIQSYYLE